MRRMTADLDVGVEIRAVETVREPDGLAISSRNVYLSPEERQRARRRCTGRCSPATRGLSRASVDYLAVVDPDTFVEVEPRPGALVIGAARFGSTRLIDNIRLEDAYEGHAASAARAEDRRNADRDGDGLRPPSGPDRRPGRRRPRARRRLGREHRARPRPDLDRRRDDGRARHPDPRRRRGLRARARDRRPAVHVLPGVRRGRRAQRRPVHQGGRRRLRQARGRAASRCSGPRRSSRAGIPVMGHIGLTPQTATMLGGHKAQGRQWHHAKPLYDDAVALEAAGCFAHRARVRARGRSRPRSRGGSRSRRSASAPAPAPTARCSCCTTCSTCTAPTRSSRSS